MNERALVKNEARLNPGVLENVIIKGDLKSLTEEQRVNYYVTLCHSLNLNPLTKPFEYMVLNGKLILYANKSCAEQLRYRDGISIEDVKVETTDDFCKVTAKAKNKEGRTDVALAVVSLIGLKGLDRANAEMKADTKAKRRVTLSICGLGMLDETEVKDIPDARTVSSEDIMSGKESPLVYTVPFGKFKDLKIEDISVEELKGYIKYIMERAAAGKRELVGDVKDFLDEANGYLESLAMDAEFNEIAGRSHL